MIKFYVTFTYLSVHLSESRTCAQYLDYFSPHLNFNKLQHLSSIFHIFILKIKDIKSSQLLHNPELHFKITFNRDTHSQLYCSSRSLPSSIQLYDSRYSHYVPVTRRDFSARLHAGVLGCRDVIFRALSTVEGGKHFLKQSEHLPLN